MDGRRVEGSCEGMVGIREPYIRTENIRIGVHIDNLAHNCYRFDILHRLMFKYSVLQVVEEIQTNGVAFSATVFDGSYCKSLLVCHAASP